MKAKGFTLIEVALAIAIVGVGFATIISLQTRYSEMYAHEQTLTKAAMYAQYLMSVLDADADFPDEAENQTDLYSALQHVGYFEDDESNSRAKKELEGWRYELQTTNISVPLVEQGLQRIDMVITWGSGEEYRLVYFLPGEAPSQP